MRAVLYAPAGGARGIGHAVRALALAEEAIGRGWDVVLAGELDVASERLMTGLPGLTRARVRSAAELAALAEGVDVVHLDCYDEELRDLKLPEIVLSNMADDQYGLRPADLTVDGSPSAPARLDQLRAAAGGHLLVGPGFAPLRRSVTSRRGDWRPQIGVSCSVLVVMGGNDAADLAVSVVAGLAELASSTELLRVSVVAPVGVRGALLAAWESSPSSLRLLEFLDDLAGEAINHDLVVTASGSTVWELGCLGVPMALVCAVANQQDNYASLVGQNAAVDLSSAPGLADRIAAHLGPVLMSPRERRRLSDAASRLVDGRGSWRVVSAWESLLPGLDGRSAAEMSVRPAVASDSSLLLSWRNDPRSRQASRQQNPVSEVEHQRWYSLAMTSPDRHLLIAMLGEEAVGTVRWDRVEDLPWETAWEVSITVAPEKRGGGLSSAVLAAGEEWLLSTVAGPVRLVATVHETNAASLRVFARGGYLPHLPADGDGFLGVARSGMGRSG